MIAIPPRSRYLKLTRLPAIAEGVSAVDLNGRAAAPRHSGRSYTPAPADLPAFPGAFKVEPKTRRKGAAYRKRWKDPNGVIYEWDSQHGTVEKYDAQGKHLGEYDPDTGEELKPADPSRKVEP